MILSLFRSLHRNDFPSTEIVRVPFCFCRQELISIQDVSVQEEVQWLRRFTESSFQALIPEEVAGSKFTKYGTVASSLLFHRDVIGL